MTPARRIATIQTKLTPQEARALRLETRRLARETKEPITVSALVRSLIIGFLTHAAGIEAYLRDDLAPQTRAELTPTPGAHPALPKEDPHGESQIEGQNSTLPF